MTGNGPVIDTPGPLGLVASMAVARRYLDARLAAAVAEARAAGFSWRVIGAAIGEPHATVHRRFRHAGARPQAEQTSSPTRRSGQ